MYNEKGNPSLYELPPNFHILQKVTYFGIDFVDSDSALGIVSNKFDSALTCFGIRSVFFPAFSLHNAKNVIRFRSASGLIPR